jgi:hypothetical protein
MFRYLVCSVTVGSILCFGRLNPLGSTSPLDGVFLGPPNLQGSPIAAESSTTRNCSLGTLTRTGGIARPESRRSTSGNLMLYNQAPIMWRSKMQKITALSTAEKDYYSALTARSDVLYLRKLLDQLGFAQQSPTTVYEDNTACIVHRVGKQHHRWTGARQAH